MGRFSTTVQIKCNSDRTSFINSFCDVMKKRGFVPCSEEEAAASYILAYGEGGWTTLANEDYRDNPKKAYEDSQQIAAAMKTSAFSIEVVDSDFAVLKLFGGNYSDEVIVGDGSGYGIEEPSRGNRECWEPLLAGGKRWEEFSQTAEKENTFVEDTLAELAEILGIASDYICADYSELSEGDSNESLIHLHFKKAKEKSMTLNAAFIKVFGEVLEPIGFKKIKGRYPYFVRVVPGGEIIHIITCRTESSDHMDEKSFDIIGGVVTTYWQSFDLTVSPSHNDWLVGNYSIYIKTNIEYDEEFKRSIYKFSYKSNSEEPMLSELKHSLDVTKKIMLPIISKVTDLNMCIDYFYKISPSWLNFMCDAEEFANDPDPYCSQSYIMIKTNYRNDGKERMERSFARTAHLMQEGLCGYSKKEFENRCEQSNKFRLEQIAIRDKILNDPVLYAKAMALLEKNRAVNIEKLKSYGINI